MSALRAALTRTLDIHSTAIPVFLGRPALEPVRLSGREGINSLFEYELLLKTPDALNLGASEAADFNLDGFIGHEISCNIQLDGAGQFIAGAVGASVDHVGAGVRQINALVSDAQVWGEEGRHVQYKLTLRPWLHLATLSIDCKIYQDKTVVQILDELLSDYDFPVDKRLIETYPTRDFQTQYNESDFDFFSRLCQEWGISYFFEHSADKHRLVLIDNMGAYHQRGIGVKADTSRAYAFWQLAADMGSSAAQAYLGAKLKGTYDNPHQGFWGNREIALKMLECSFAQGSGEGAYELATTLANRDGKTPEFYARALLIYHEGVKLGCKDCANTLSVRFDRTTPLTGNTIDTARAERYSELGDALELNPDLRFPNLDKVLPLPPAPLPFWDGERETLIDAAKAVIVKQPTPVTAGANRTGRAHIPQGHVLTADIAPPPDENAYDNKGRPWSVKAKQQAHFTGYWLPQIDVVRGDWQVNWNAAQVPLHFKRGELLPNLTEDIPPGYGDVSWYYKGLPAQQAASSNPYVTQGIARYVPAPEVPRSCSGTSLCPQTGIWSARLKKEHAHHAVFHEQWQQAYVEKGQPFPVPTTLHEAGGITVAARDMRWRWVGDANQPDASGHVHVTLNQIST